MEPLKPPATYKVYTVIKQSGMAMNYVYVSMPNSLNFGSGFYGTRHEAEQARRRDAHAQPQFGASSHERGNLECGHGLRLFTAVRRVAGESS